MECTVHTVSDAAPRAVSLPAGSCAEDAVLAACRSLNVAPITRPLYALRDRNSLLFLPDAGPVKPLVDYELRIRFKVSNLHHLRSLDANTYDYYFRQARNDVVDNCVPEIQYAQHKKELLGLGIADMYRAIQEDNKTLREVERHYKKYIPKEIIRKHQFFTKKPIHNTLEQWCQKTTQNPTIIKAQYLEQLCRLAPNYLSEVYSVHYMPFGGHGNVQHVPARLHLMPFHEAQPGLRLFDEVKRKWVHLCTMEQLIFLGRKALDTEVEVCRKNGVQVYLRFTSAEETSSFISGCGGYYRLMVKWTFNLSKDDLTPSLERLYSMKCHGPVGGEFSYHKLNEKGSKRHGCFILRQCQHDYHVYYMDVCTENNTVETYKVEFKGHCYTFNGDESKTYSSIEHLVKSFGDPQGRIYLKECLPASEYDKSQLLLCGEQYKVGVRIDQAELQELLKHHKSPRCINTRDILIFKGWQVLGAEGITATYKAIWKLDDKKKMEVALKTLVKEKTDSHLKDFIELANKWAGVQSSSVVRLYGVTLMSPSALVMEYLQYGPLNVFLSENSDGVKPLHLTMAAAGLARALLDLSEANCVHGRIRCSKVLLAHHDSHKLTVKLSDPGLHSYTNDDIHWIPVEFFSDMSLARRYTTADVWAFGTTLWEIFSYGLSPNETNPVLRQKTYEQGHRLSCPAECPREVWTAILSCWSADPHRRAIPQVVMRDISHVLHRETISAANPYATIIDVSESDMGVYEGTGAETVSSDHMFNKHDDNTSNTSRATADSDLSFPSTSVITLLTQTPEHNASVDSQMPFDTPDCYGVSEPDIHSMQWILGMGPKSSIQLLNPIGSGNYGEVYKGFLEREGVSQLQTVAVKRLKSHGDQGTLNDFRKEIDIMKTLQHPNIVEILGVCEEREMLIVMDYLEHGALSLYLRMYRDKVQHSDLIKYASDVASGMEYLSSKHVVHRDLAARNILVKHHRHVQISDFGLARFTTDNDVYRMKTMRDLPLNWYSPEATQGEFSTASDVWSYGVTLWEMFTFCRVEVPKLDLTALKTRAECFAIPTDCPQEVYRRLMQPCWNYRPELRPKFIQLVHVCKQFQMAY